MAVVDLPAPSTKPDRKNPFRRPWVIVCVAVIILSPIGFVLVDQWLPRMLLDHYRFDVDENPAQFKQHKVSHERVELKTRDGLRIVGWYVPEPQSDVTVIVLHTVGRSRQDMLDFALPLRQHGFSLLFIDMRGHGESGGQHFTYGYHEWKDVAAAVDFAKERGGKETHVVLLGASAGGAVAILAAARDPRVAAVCSVAAFHDLRAIVKHQTPWLPDRWADRALRKAEELGDFKVDKTCPVDDIQKLSCPVLIAHGDQDQYVPSDCARRLKEAGGDNVTLHWIRGANHATMFAIGGDKLIQAIAEFFSTSGGK
jgi:uncharacterized protein